MRQAMTAVALGVALGAWVALAGGGELKPVSKGLEGELGPTSGFVGCDPVRGATGLTSGKAVVASFPVGAGRTIKVALDYSRDSLDRPDVVRFDFTGKGAFNNTQVAKLAWPSGAPPGAAVDFGPATVTVEQAGRTLSVGVQGYCYRRDQGGRSTYLLRAGFVTAAEGPCEFGQKSYTVRVVDSSGNLSFRDGLKLPVGGNPYAAILAQNADKVMVSSQDGTLAAWACYGQPLRVDGEWYTATLSDDQTSVTATKLDVPMAELRPAAADWEALLVGRKYVLTLSGGKEPIRIPADTYALGACSEHGLRDGRRAGELMCVGDARPVAKAEGGGPVDLPALVPLKAKLSVQQNGDTVVFSFEMKSASGLEVSTLTVADERGNMARPQPPRVKVFNANGKLVYQADLRYG